MSLSLYGIPDWLTFLQEKPSCVKNCKRGTSGKEAAGISWQTAQEKKPNQTKEIHKYFLHLMPAATL